ncbi:hypothetical protein J4423_01760 [Candidatus Pacearchaeota archaeon]|nr:hypothetical protein [Candidatus Pacearchaeota archaeon]
MKGIIFNFKALREYSEGIRVCRGYLEDYNYHSALEGCNYLRIILEQENRFEKDAKQVIRQKIERLELKATDFILKSNSTNNNPTPPYNGAS